MSGVFTECRIVRGRLVWDPFEWPARELVSPTTADIDIAFGQVESFTSMDELVANLKEKPMGKAIMEPSNKTGWRRWLWPLRSRKVLVAVATCVVAWAAEAGIVLSPETTLVVLAAGVSVILGVAIEDHGEKAGK